MCSERMGSLKHEMRGPAEDPECCGITTTEDQVSPGSSDISSTPEGPQTDMSPEGPQTGMSQQSTSQEDKAQSKRRDNVAEGGDEDPTISKGLSGDTDRPDSVLAQDCIQSLDTPPQTQQQTDAEPNSQAKPPPAMPGEETISPRSTPDEPPADLTQMDGDSEELSEEKEKDDGVEDKGEKGRKGRPVSSSQDPGTPAPFGQHHMHTQVSLEVVQCHSVATSPMTPPEGDQAFFFPYSSGQSARTEMKEFRSVATAPMTPKTPTAPATFPEISGREREHTEERMKERVEQGQADQVQQASCTVTKCPAVSESGPESIPALKCNTPKEAVEGTCSNSFVSPEISINCPPTMLGSSLVTLEDSKQPCKQHGLRMGSMDQDITILVTHHDSTEADDEEGGVDTELSVHPARQEVAKVDESDELNVNTSEAVQKATEVDSALGKVATIKQISTKHSTDGKNVGSGRAQDVPITSTKHLQNKGDIEGLSIRLSKHPEIEKDYSGQNKQMSGIKETKEEDARCGADTKKVSQSSEPECPPPASSPAPFGQQHMRTQVSLEVVQSHSVATSPMTPPEGDQAFSFPYSSGRTAGNETKDGELQAGQRVEFRSVATAPMTPQTPTAPTEFPETGKDEMTENISEQEEVKEKKKPTAAEKAAEDKKNVLTRGDVEEEVVEEEMIESVVGEQEEKACKEKCEEKAEELVQDVSWDEKGMTWEVYGAVVEVAVLGSAIQKHLEKQVKKHRKQPSLPPPPPLSPSAVPLTPTSPPTSGSAQGSSGRKKRGERDGKLSRRRRNPFRLMMQPHCCSRAHATE